MQKTRNFMLPSTQENELIEQNKLLPHPQQKNNPWVETRARAGNFGAPVFFEDVSAEALAKEDTPQQTLDEETSGLVETATNELAEKAEPDFVETIAKEQEQIESPKSEQNIVNTQENASEIQSLQKEKEIAEIEQQPLNMANKAIETNNVVFNATQSSFAKASDPAPSFAKGFGGHGKATSDTSANTPSVTTKIKPPTPSSSANRSSNAFSKAPAKENALKPPITLAQLTQGFLHHRKEQSGSYGISMLGMKRGIPSEEQMRYERYLQKLVWCLQNSFNINRYKQPAISSDVPVHVFFSLDRDGILQHLSIKKSSGNMYIDQFVLFIFQDASSSFPPVPSYLTDNPFSMTCVVS
jgi:hypothetical protein